MYWTEPACPNNERVIMYLTAYWEKRIKEFLELAYSYGVSKENLLVAGLKYQFPGLTRKQAGQLASEFLKNQIVA